MDINTLSWKDNTLRVNYLSGKTLEVSPVSFFEYMYLSDIHSSCRIFKYIFQKENL